MNITVKLNRRIVDLCRHIIDVLLKRRPKHVNIQKEGKRVANQNYRKYHICNFRFSYLMFTHQDFRKYQSSVGSVVFLRSFS